MTKEQERAALAKIKKIIDETGPDSYLSLTFEGILEQAEQNITDDFASNYKYMYETARAEVGELTREIREQRDEIKQAKDETEKYIAVCREHIAEKDDIDARLAEERREHAETVGKLLAAENDKKALQAEIITLKAKLYDLMTQ